MSTFEEEAAVTFDWLAPVTCTRPAEVLETAFRASSPVADARPERAVVMVVGAGVAAPTVGARATDKPDWAAALLASVMRLEC
jgi:hypothetical protein